MNPAIFLLIGAVIALLASPDGKKQDTPPTDPAPPVPPTPEPHKELMIVREYIARPKRKRKRARTQDTPPVDPPTDPAGTGEPTGDNPPTA